MNPGSEIGRVAAEVAALEGLGIDALREVWRGRFNDPPPPVRAGDLMRRCLAERIQEEAFGKDLELERDLAKLARAHRPGKPLSSPRPRIRIGTRLVREHDGETHTVDVNAEGFLWRGKAYKSLSVIAREITGVRWNGPRFFGLRAESAE